MKVAAGVTVAAGTGAGVHQALRHSIRVGLLGAGERGRYLAMAVGRSRWFPIYGKLVAVCDVDRIRAEAVRNEYAPAAEVTQSAIRLLERDDVEAVFIATPDHAHVPLALAALQAGKHVYCEKPLSLTIDEGRRLADAVQASDRAFLVGTQQRSFSRFQTACELVRNGRLGEVRRVDICVEPNLTGGPFRESPVPEALDWSAWLGETPPVDYCSERFEHYRGWFAYGGGTLADWGAHQLDIAHWALGLDRSGPVAVSGEATLPEVENGYDVPEQFAVELKYADGTTIRIRTGDDDYGILFTGDEGRIFVNRKRLGGSPVERLADDPLPADSVRFGHCRSYWSTYGMTHVRHFFDCVRRGDAPISDVETGHRTATACHLANIALRLGRSVRWNPDREAFVS
jgi:predicted dehydrogenase